ncbi:hypothetical protein [Sphingomonas sp. 8AM]|uniref:hypothetical protein n=1 Tax=Sphingomonas sp. 8AM TaxID=2653170 RepID=UPI0012F09C47|nr:hypothetical protein [Sphingomonas sp. 8AM]VXD02892.1 hypothetical protein SPHINGO8AM_80277 [Sphingomonas sp. 8AM]
MSETTSLISDVLVPYETVKRNPQPNVLLQVAWANYWGTEYGSSAFWFAYSQYLEKFERLSVEIVARAKDDRSRSLFLSAINKLKGPLDASYLGSSVSSLAGLDETFNIIHLANSIIPEKAAPTIEVATLQAVVARLVELREGLAESEIDVDLKTFLRSQLVFLEWAAANFEALGIEGLSKAYGMVASEVVRTWGVAATSEDVSSDPWWGKARATLRLIGEGVIWSEKVAGGADKLLGFPEHLSKAIT